MIELTLHSEKMIGLLLPDKVHLADVTFTEQLDLLE